MLMRDRFAPLLEASGTRKDPSRFVIVSSTAGRSVPHAGENGTIMYSVSKAAAHVSISIRTLENIAERRQHLGRNLAVELGPRNITSNVVAPGFFPSKLASGLIEKLGGEDELGAANPRRRLGEPEDIAGVMVYLCSPAGSYMYALLQIDPAAFLRSNHFAEMALISLLMAGWFCHLVDIRSYKQTPLL